MSLESQRALLQALGLVPAEPEEATEEQSPSFDGGAREAAPGPSDDPEIAHNQFLLEVLRQASQGRR